MVTEFSEEQKITLKAKKFIVWLFVVSSAIMFGGWTSYYIVFSAAKGKGHGLVLPDAFMYSTVILLVSSICLFMARQALKNQKIAAQRALLWLTIFLGIGFGVMQFQAWYSLYQSGAVIVSNNASISMIWILSSFHLLHIVAGICIIGGVLAGTYKQIAPERINFRMQIASIFWHFIDILWIYLYVFLLLNR
ncbi:MAG: heme-copper oxidase subunit III [Pedobacter sp.]|nr:MAG: heme-copper oxidase subunit III [Pedobacter sp.]